MESILCIDCYACLQKNTECEHWRYKFDNELDKECLSEEKDLQRSFCSRIFSSEFRRNIGSISCQCGSTDISVYKTYNFSWDKNDTHTNIQLRSDNIKGKYKVTEVENSDNYSYCEYQCKDCKSRFGMAKCGYDYCFNCYNTCCSHIKTTIKSIESALDYVPRSNCSKCKATGKITVKTYRKCRFCDGTGGIGERCEMCKGQRGMFHSNRIVKCNKCKVFIPKVPKSIKKVD